MNPDEIAQLNAERAKTDLDLLHLIHDFMPLLQAFGAGQDTLDGMVGAFDGLDRDYIAIVGAAPDVTLADLPASAFVAGPGMFGA